MLKDIFVSEVRVKILKLMLPKPDRQLHVRAIVREVGTEINAVRRELQRLSKLGLLRSRQSSNKIYYTVDISNVYYPELLALVAKEAGMGGKIVAQIKNLGNIRYAVLSTAFVKGRESTVLDVDLFIVGSVNFEVLEKIIKEEEAVIGKEINYTVMGEDEFVFRKRRNDQFIAKVLSQSRTMLIGDGDEFCKI